MQSIARVVASFVSVCSVLLVGVGIATAEDPEGEPVKWDQARVTQYSVEMADAIDKAVDAMRKSPMHNVPTQRTAYYELKEDLRLLENSATHLQSKLQGGAGMEETAATFDRIDLLRRQAEEHGRRSEIPASVLDDLVTAGSLHMRMSPYYHGKR